MERLRRQRYTKEFKEEAVKMVYNEKLQVAEAARRLNIPKETLMNWIRKYENTGDLADRQRKEEVKEPEAELARLKRELAEKTMECEILKKATAYFAKESQRGAR